MNGPQHWVEADLILTGDSGDCEYGCPHSGCQHEMRLIARAQVHATLALAAAVVDFGAPNAAEIHGWREAIDPPEADDAVAVEVTR